MNLEKQHIIGLQISNIKKIAALNLDIDDKNGTIILSGKNSAGKSSILDAITMAICGKTAIPSKPIKEGETNASIILETEEIIVKRKITQANSYLEITNKEGLKYSKPQEILDKLITIIGFDPLNFSKLDTKEQTKELIKIAQVNFDFEKNLNELIIAEENRKILGRDIKRLEAHLSSIINPKVEIADEVSIIELAQQLNALQKEVAYIEELKNHLFTSKLKQTSLRQEITALQHDLETEIIKTNTLDNEIETFKDKNHILAIENITNQINDFENINNNVRAQKTYNKVQQELHDKNEEIAASNNQIKQLRLSKIEALKNSKLPINGLMIDDNNIINYNNIPLIQCSTSEQIKVGVALAVAANPILRVIFIKDGSLLDNDSMQMLKSLAIENDLQIWIERVDDTSPGTLQIIDGQLI